MKRSDDRPGRKQRRTTMTANNKIETASRDSAELGLDELMHVTGGGDTADAVAKLVGKAVWAIPPTIKHRNRRRRFCTCSSEVCGQGGLGSFGISGKARPRQGVRPGSGLGEGRARRAL